MNRKSILIIIIPLALVSGIFVINKSRTNDFYKEDNIEVKEEVSNIENSNTIGENITENEEVELKENSNYSDEDLDITKEIGLKFIPLVHSYDLDNGHESSVKEATKYATESMKNFLIGTFVESKQPVLFKDFYAREVEEVRAIESKVSEDSISWEFEVKSKILNKNNEMINEEQNRVDLLFVKENGEWRVGNYATTQYR